MFKYECPYCEQELSGSFGDNVYCAVCNITFETECDYNLDAEGGESYYAWLTGIEHKGKVK